MRKQKRKQKAQGAWGRWTTNIADSFVMTMAAVTSCVSDSAGKSKWWARRLHVPPERVAHNDNECCGRALLLGMEGVFGCTVKTFLETQMSNYSICLFVFVMDAASANFLTLKKIYALLCLSVYVTNTLVLVHLDVCALHRVGRILKRMLWGAGKLDCAFYCVSRASYSTKNHIVFKKAFVGSLLAKFSVRDLAGVHDDKETPVYSVIRKCLRVDWQFDSEVLERDMTAGDETFESWFAFFFDDTAPFLSNQRASHRHGPSCVGICDGTWETAKEEARRRIYSQFFETRPPLYNPGRWTKHLPCSIYHASFLFVDQDAYLDGLRAVAKGTTNEKRLVRLAKAISRLAPPMTRFIMMRALGAASCMGSLVYLLFSGASRQGQRDVDTSSDGKQVSFVYLVARAVRQLMRVLWGALIGRPITEGADAHVMNMSSLAEMLKSMAPDGEDVTWRSLSTIGELWLELWQNFGEEHETKPHTWVELELLEGGREASNLAWSKASGDLSDTKECCLPWAAQVWKQYLNTMADSMRGRVLRECHFHFAMSKNKGSNLKEERMHRFQKSHAGGFDRSATSFTRQVTEMVCHEIAATYMDNGGRDLSMCARGLVEDFKASKSEIPKEPRPKQMGNAIIKFQTATLNKIRAQAKRKIDAEEADKIRKAATT